MGDIAQHSRAVLFVSHNVGAIQALCSRTVLLQDGRIALDRTPAEAVERYMRTGGADSTSLWFETVGIEPVDLTFDKSWPLATAVDRARAFGSWRRALKQLTATERRDACGQLASQFPEHEAGRLLDKLPSMRMSWWREVEMLHRAGVGMGAPGVEHETHNARRPLDVQREELQGGKAELERRLGIEYLALATPTATSSPRSSRWPGRLAPSLR